MQKLEKYSIKNKVLVCFWHRFVTFHVSDSSNRMFSNLILLSLASLLIKKVLLAQIFTSSYFEPSITFKIIQ